MRDTIFALASGAVPCAVAVIRISGSRASVVAKLCWVSFRTIGASFFVSFATRYLGTS